MRPCTTGIGALGRIAFDKGWYIYTGSALGAGGLSRVSRHIRFYREQYRTPKWHIDYLMSAGDIFLRETICGKTESDLECALAAAVSGTGIAGFGCSDCDCATHLFYRKENPEKELLAAFEKLGLQPVQHFPAGM
jgi:Uri superfamily endonuclease